MKRAPAVVTLVCCCLLAAGCIVSPPRGPAVAAAPLCGPPVCGPSVSYGSCQSVDPYCLANPGRYAEPMHPVIGTNGSPYLLPQSGLREIVNPTPPATLPGAPE